MIKNIGNLKIENYTEILLGLEKRELLRITNKSIQNISTDINLKTNKSLSKDHNENVLENGTLIYEEPENTQIKIIEYEDLTFSKEVGPSQIINFGIKSNFSKIVLKKNLTEKEANDLSTLIESYYGRNIEIFEKNINKLFSLILNSIKHNHPYSILSNYSSILNESIQKFLQLVDSKMTKVLGRIIYKTIESLLNKIEEKYTLKIKDANNNEITIKNEILTNISPYLIEKNINNTQKDDDFDLIIDVEDDSLIIDIDTDTSKEPTNAMPSNKTKQPKVTTFSKTSTTIIGSEKWVNELKNIIEESSEQNEILDIIVSYLIQIINKSLKKSTPETVLNTIINITDNFKKNLSSNISNRLVKAINKSEIATIHNIEASTLNNNFNRNAVINGHMHFDLTTKIGINSIIDNLLGDVYAGIKDANYSEYIPSKYLSKCKNIKVLRLLAISSENSELQLNILKHRDHLCERIISQKPYLSKIVIKELLNSKYPDVLETVYSSDNFITRKIARELLYSNKTVSELTEAQKNFEKRENNNFKKEKPVELNNEILNLRDKINNFVELNHNEDLLYAKLKGIAKLRTTPPYILYNLAMFNDTQMRDIISQNPMLDEITATYLLSTEDLIAIDNIALNPSPFLIKKSPSNIYSPVEIILNFDIDNPRLRHFIARRKDIPNDTLLRVLKKYPNDVVFFTLISTHFGINYDIIDLIINSKQLPPQTALAKGNAITLKSIYGISSVNNVDITKAELNKEIKNKNYYKVLQYLQKLVKIKQPLIIDTLSKNKLAKQYIKQIPSLKDEQIKTDIKNIIKFLKENKFSEELFFRMPIDTIIEKGDIEDKLDIIYSNRCSNSQLTKLARSNVTAIKLAVIDMTNNYDILYNIDYKSSLVVKNAFLKKTELLNSLIFGKVNLRPRNKNIKAPSKKNLLAKFKNETIKYADLIKLSLSDNYNDLEELANFMAPEHIEAWVNILSSNYNAIREIAMKRSDLSKNIYQAIVEITNYNVILDIASKARYTNEETKELALKKLEISRLWNENRELRKKNKKFSLHKFV